jgi:hypothetical protein
MVQKPRSRTTALPGQFQGFCHHKGFQRVIRAPTDHFAAVSCPFLRLAGGPATKAILKTTPDNKKTRRPAKAQDGGNK